MAFARQFRQYINPAGLAIVVVGDWKTIEAGLMSANIGPVEIRSMSGQPIQ